MDIKRKNLKMFKGMLEVIEEQSKCTRKRVAALIVKDDRVISTGYNGLVSGDDDSRCKLGCTGCEETVHAEMNAILFAAKVGVPTEGTTLISSYSPCINCAKHIINAGITSIIYNKNYSDSKGISKLLQSGVRVFQFIGDKDLIEYHLPKDNVNDNIKIDYRVGHLLLHHNSID